MKPQPAKPRSEFKSLLADIPDDLAEAVMFEQLEYLIEHHASCRGTECLECRRYWRARAELCNAIAF